MLLKHLLNLISLPTATGPQSANDTLRISEAPTRLRLAAICRVLAIEDTDSLADHDWGAYAFAPDSMGHPVIVHLEYMHHCPYCIRTVRSPKLDAVCDRCDDNCDA